MRKKSILIIITCLFTLKCFAQNTADTTANALSFPSTTGPLTPNPTPFKFDKIYISGVVSGLAQAQNNVARGDKALQTDISNAQIFIQKNTGLIQFFIEAGAYSQPDLGVPYLRSGLNEAAFYGIIPQGYLEIAPSDNFSFMIGKLAAFMGAEPTFSFQNMNIQRGLLWDQSNSVNRGIQVNYSAGPIAIALSYNDGFYSNKYNWLSGTLTYALDKANTFVLMGGGSLSRTNISTSATPLYQNNGQGYNLIYTHTAGSFTILPYLQYTVVPKSALLNTAQTAKTYSAALLVNYSVPHTGFSLPVRVEYVKTTGSAAQGAPNLMYGVGSNAWSATVTPTYQYKRVFVRSEFSYVRAGNITSGMAFGPEGNDAMQSRVLLETGFIF
ncbi:putative OmpL-like beta-barrel porin-2 [Mucilaginibacter yixingensis]|uniref:Putative OmpL-like beta-barrel porin-2 n=1 Tax=Mucilaginibacter yixingensis TaxID=1295612 RepID=A0A2T5JD97_9SPHI|nr:outer membrane beta-barrel protein [Mucilaginibacter yixingensis]PTQ99741.1 putative OmpL-like beta-barrel porin-2 [Mucilaginibacter yixingensis]